MGVKSTQSRAVLSLMKKRWRRTKKASLSPALLRPGTTQMKSLLKTAVSRRLNRS
ncbi:hypothetical protein PO124_16275 [Bacillus licheniformis]|nr:hypothetical protein [Bacillus licheniformis]